MLFTSPTLLSTSLSHPPPFCSPSTSTSPLPFTLSHCLSFTLPPRLIPRPQLHPSTTSCYRKCHMVHDHTIPLNHSFKNLLLLHHGLFTVTDQLTIYSDSLHRPPITDILCFFGQMKATSYTHALRKCIKTLGMLSAEQLISWQFQN